MHEQVAKGMLSNEYMMSERVSNEVTDVTCMDHARRGDPGL